MILSIREAAEAHGVTNQAIFVAIKNKKLKATREKNSRWCIREEDLKEYVNQLYSRRTLKHNGELVYPPGKGILSVNAAANMLNVKPHKIYYAIYKNRIKYDRKGCAYVIHMDALCVYARNNSISFDHG